MGQLLMAAFAMSVLVEALIEYFGQGIPSNFKIWAAALVGVVLCVLYGVDALGLILSQFQLQPVVPMPWAGYLGSVLTGLLISRGANVFNDLVSRLNIVKTPSTTVDSIEREAPVPPADHR